MHLRMLDTQGELLGPIAQAARAQLDVTRLEAQGLEWHELEAAAHVRRAQITQLGDPELVIVCIAVRDADRPQIPLLACLLLLRGRGYGWQGRLPPLAQLLELGPQPQHEMLAAHVLRNEAPAQQLMQHDVGVPTRHVEPEVHVAVHHLEMQPAQLHDPRPETEAAPRIDAQHAGRAGEKPAERSAQQQHIDEHRLQEKEESEREPTLIGAKPNLATYPALRCPEPAQP